MGRLIDTDRLKEVFSRNVVGGNAYFDLIDNAPTVEAIPKAEYEARLKADMIAILTEIKLKITEKSYYDTTIIGNYEDEVRIDLVELDDVNDIIQNKINTLEVEDGNDD